MDTNGREWEEGKVRRGRLFGTRGLERLVLGSRLQYRVVGRWELPRRSSEEIEYWDVRAVLLYSCVLNRDGRGVRSPRDSL